MNQAESLQKDKKIGIIGFNARPLACSSSRAGANVYVSDYWGDDDLDACATNTVSVLDPKPGLRQREIHERPAYIHLVENFLTTFLKEELNHIFVGSGFDDHTDSLMPIESQWKIAGNSTMAMKRARDWKLITKLSDDVGFLVPQRKFANSHETVAEICREFEFPCVVRGLGSGGGSGIALAREEKDIPKAFRKASIKRRTSLVIVQEYIPGVDVSSSVLGTGKEASTLSVQGQLIGMPSSGRYSDFVYCGNYIPVGLSSETHKRIREGSEYMINKLQLKGSNGLDFVVDSKDNIWFMEINPRFQGTLEMLEVAGDISISDLHLRAVSGELPMERPSFRPAVKLVVFARKRGKVPDLKKYTSTVDRSPRGVIVEAGDPVCTIIETGETVKACYSTAKDTAESIQRDIG